MRDHTAALLVAALALPLLGPLGAMAAEPAEEILKRADLVRGPEEPFSLKLNVTAYRGTDVLNATSVLVNTHDFSRSLVEFVSPPRDAGRKLRLVAEDLWVHLPGRHLTSRITPRQRLLGQAS